MVYNARCSPLPLINAEGEEAEDSNNESGKCTSIDPGVLAASKASTGEEEGEADHEKATSEKIKMSDFVPEGKMVQLGVPLGRSIREPDGEYIGTPEGSLEPLYRLPSIICCMHEAVC